MKPKSPAQVMEANVSVQVELVTAMMILSIIAESRIFLEKSFKSNAGVIPGCAIQELKVALIKVPYATPSLQTSLKFLVKMELRRYVKLVTKIVLTTAKFYATTQCFSVELEKSIAKMEKHVIAMLVPDIAETKQSAMHSTCDQIQL